MVLLLAAALHWGLRRPKLSKYPYPPGPKPKILLGNLLDIPAKNLSKVYVEWGKRYQSSILHAEVAGNHIVILNSVKDAKELLERRSQIYSDRPRIPMAEITGWDFSVVLMPYGDKWRMARKICQQNFRKDAVARFEATHTRKINDMLRALLSTPQDFALHSRMVSAAITMSTMYGYDVSSMNDPFVVVYERAANEGSRWFLPGAALVNSIPALRHLPSWFPGTWFNRVGEELKVLTTELQNAPMDHVKKRMLEGNATPCLVSRVLEDLPSEEMENSVKCVAGTVYGAASDTTVSATITFIYAMTTHPEIQMKAQAELDRVVGTDRLPSYADRASLPYIEAIYRELLRWRPPLNMGIPHSSTKDDIYEGYFIPEGTVVMSNIWAMAHDPAVYPNHEEFAPERFFDHEGNLNNDDFVLAYGFGRRVCAGQHLASSTMWYTIACILATFAIRKATDENGEEIEIDDAFTDNSLISHKTPFKCSITPRSDKAKRLVQETGLQQ